MIKFTKKQLKEHPEWFIENFCCIQDKNTGEYKSIKLNIYQKISLRKLYNERI